MEVRFTYQGNTEIENIIQKEVEENLDVISSGPVPPNASELMLSNRVEEMFTYLKKHYDYIFIDTPPVGYISDGIVLLKHVDASVFVMNTKMANRKGLKYLEEIVEKSQLTNKGLY